MSDPDSPLARFTIWRAALPTALRWLLTVNVATYLAYVALSIVGMGEALRWLALPATPGGALATPWSVLTYGSTNLYPGFFGLITFAFGVLWLNWLGRDLEETYGSHQLFGLYVLTTLGGAALALALGAFQPGALDVAAGPGVWAGVWAPMMGVLCGLATMQPDRKIGLFLLGPVALKWIAIVLVVLDLAFSKDPTRLGAALTGFLFGRAQLRGAHLGAWSRPLFERRRAARPAPRPEAAGVFARAVRRSAPPGGEAAPRAAGKADIDRILDKILEDGYESLTPDERRALDEASRD